MTTTFVSYYQSRTPEKSPFNAPPTECKKLSLQYDKYDGWQIATIEDQCEKPFPDAITTQTLGRINASDAFKIYRRICKREQKKMRSMATKNFDWYNENINYTPSYASSFTIGFKLF